MILRLAGLYLILTVNAALVAVLFVTHTGWPPRRWCVAEYSPVLGYVVHARTRTRLAATLTARRHWGAQVMTVEELATRNAAHDARARAWTPEQWTLALRAERALRRRP